MIVTLLAGLGYQTLQLSSVRTAYSDFKADVATKAEKASEAARATEQQRQRDIDQVRDDAAAQKEKDDARAAELLAAGDSLREQTNRLLADRAALSARLAARGKTINDFTDLYAELREEADRAAGDLATALDDSRRAGFACEKAYGALTKRQTPTHQ
jgi:chromosome segregation ATPase